MHRRFFLARLALLSSSHAPSVVLALSQFHCFHCPDPVGASVFQVQPSVHGCESAVTLTLGWQGAATLILVEGELNATCSGRKQTPRCRPNKRCGLTHMSELSPVSNLSHRGALKKQKRNFD